VDESGQLDGGRCAGQSGSGVAAAWRRGGRRARGERFLAGCGGDSAAETVFESHWVCL